MSEQTGAISSEILTREEMLRRASKLLHRNALKEEQISPTLKSYIRSVVYNTQQVNSTVLSVSGEEQPAIRMDDIVVMIDAKSNRVIMKKDDFEPIVFDLVEKTVQVQGIVFDLGNGEIHGITDEVDLEHPRADFTVSERVVAPLIIDMGDIRDKLDEIIDMITGVQASISTLGIQLEDVQANILQGLIYNLDTLKAYIQERHVVIENRFTAVDGEISTLSTVVQSGFETLKNDVDGRFDSISSDILEVSNNLDMFKEDVDETFQLIKNNLDVEAIQISRLDDKMNQAKTELDEIKTMVQTLIDRP
jgi:hypothetical protein